MSAKGFLFLTVHHHLGDFEPKKRKHMFKHKATSKPWFRYITLSLLLYCYQSWLSSCMYVCVCVCVKVTIFPLSLSPKTNPLFLSVLVYYRLLILNRQRTEMAVNISLSFLFLPFSLARAHF